MMFVAGASNPHRKPQPGAGVAIKHEERAGLRNDCCDGLGGPCGQQRAAKVSMRTYHAGTYTYTDTQTHRHRHRHRHTDACLLCDDGPHCLIVRAHRHRLIQMILERQPALRTALQHALGDRNCLVPFHDELCLVLAVDLEAGRRHTKSECERPRM